MPVGTTHTDFAAKALEWSRWIALGTLKFKYFPQGGIVELEEGAEIGATDIEVVAFIGICHEMSSGAAASGRGEPPAPRASARRAARPEAVGLHFVLAQPWFAPKGDVLRTDHAARKSA